MPLKYTDKITVRFVAYLFSVIVFAAALDKAVEEEEEDLD
jgi:hypothetical protein